MEQLRNLTWQELTDASYLQNNVLNTAPTAVGSLNNVTETLTLNAYPVAVSPSLTVTRSDGVATIVSSNITLADRDIVRLDATVAWSAGLGHRSHTQSSATIISKQAQ